MLEEMKKRVFEMNQKLQEQRLVAMTSGNVSGRHEDFVVVDLQGNMLEGDKRPPLTSLCVPPQR